MSTLVAEISNPRATSVRLTDDTLSVDLSDGRSISAPLVWYPRLLQGTPVERANFRLIANGTGIHWPALDEDISVENILAGKQSGESHESFRQWFESRQLPGKLFVKNT